MDLDQVRHFVRIAELGSFSRAEAALDISQPSLSRQIRLLEQSLQQKLFQRTGRGVTLTAAGATFLPHALAILETVRRSESALSERDNNLAGRIVVGLPPRIARVLTGPLVEEFRKQFPNASIVIAEGLSPILIDGIKLGQIELALLFNAQNDSQLHLETICSEELVLVGPAKSRHKLSAAMKFQLAAQFPLILPPMPNSVRTTIEMASKRVRVDLDVIVEVNTMHAVLDLVRRGVGYSIIPRGLLMESQKGDRFAVCDIIGPKLENTVMLATPARLPMTKLGQGIVELIQKLDTTNLLGAKSLRGSN